MEIKIRIPQTAKRQQEIIFNFKQNNVISCGRRFGKTYMCTALAMSYLVEGLPVGWFCPTYKFLTDVYKKIEKTLEPLIAERNSMTKEIRFKTGGVLDCWTMDGKDPGRGKRYALIIIDEAALQPDLMRLYQEAIEPTLLDMNGRSVIISTPQGYGDFKELYQMEESFGNWKSFHAPTSENPLISREYLAQKEIELDPKIFRQEYLAEFVSSSGFIFKKEWFKYYDTLPERLDYSFIVCDTAMKAGDGNDYTVVAHFGKVDNLLFLLDFQRGKWETPEMLEVMNNFYQRAKEFNRTGFKGQPVVRDFFIEDQFSGIIVLQNLSLWGIPVTEMTRTKDKVARARDVTPYFKNGHILLPRNGKYNKDIEDEMTSFDGDGRHRYDDIVDVFVDATREGLYNIPPSGIISVRDSNHMPFISY